MVYFEMSDTMDSLEARLAELERLIMGKNPEPADTTSDTRSVAELLATAKTLMDTKLARREHVEQVVNRLDELERYIDPNYEDSSRLGVSAKMELLLARRSDLVERSNQLNELARLLPVLDSEAIESAPQHRPRLEKLLTVALDQQKLVGEESAQVADLLQQYNTLAVNISKTFLQWDNKVTDMEQSYNVVKKLDVAID